MSRTSKHDRPFRNAPKPVQMTVQEYRRRVIADVRRRMKAAGLISSAPKYEYHWQYGDQGGIVPGNQKTDARHLIKKALGVEKLPPGVQIVRVIPNADQQQRLAACQIGPVSA